MTCALHVQGKFPQLKASDVFGWYILFSQRRPLSDAIGKYFPARAYYERIYYEWTKAKFPWEHLVIWTECKERRPCWCSQLIFRGLNFIIIQRLSFLFWLKNILIDHLCENTLQGTQNFQAEEVYRQYTKSKLPRPLLYEPQGKLHQFGYFILEENVPEWESLEMDNQNFR